MKVIGKTQDGYIAEISHHEIEKFLNLYYNKLGKLSLNEEIDLGKGYDFYHASQAALTETRSFIEKNGKIIQGIIGCITSGVIHNNE